MLTLHFAPHTVCLATMIVLEELELDYQLKTVDFAASEQRTPSFLELNPKGRVPVLATDEGLLSETPALLVYLAECHGRGRLLPSTAFARAQLQAFNSYLCATVHIAHAHRMRGERWTDDAAALAALRAKVPQSVTAAFRVIDEGLAPGSWVMGDDFSVGDAYLFTLAQWLELDGVDTSQVGRVLSHRERMHERPSVQKALHREANP